ncbi:MAG: transposase [Gammaproteobacteria bacterium]|nr:transposase [Gammaproteobacteria bacterium]
MARLPRLVIPGQPLHLIQRGNNREPCFFADDDYRFYLDSLEDASRRYGCRLHAYVLMTNHVHLLLTPESVESPSVVLQSVGRRYVRYINHVYRRTGTLWEGRYKSALIDSDRYLLICSRYIELNPVRARMVSQPGDYRWSSYRHNALGQTDTLLTPHFLYINLDADDTQRCMAYRALFNAHTDPMELQAIRSATETGTVLGSNRFKENIETTLKRRIERLPHGGDRKSEVFRDQHKSIFD